MLVWCREHKKYKHVGLCSFTHVPEGQTCTGKVTQAWFLSIRGSTGRSFWAIIYQAVQPTR